MSLNLPSIYGDEVTLACFYIPNLHEFSLPEKYHEDLSQSDLLAGSNYSTATRDLMFKRRWVLRQVLASYSGISPAQLEISREQDKPCLTSDTISDFNVSHCRDNTLVCIATKGGCGVDLERIRFVHYNSRIISRLRSEMEPDSVNISEDFFFRFWTRKEAIVKFFGEGLLKFARHYDVSNSKVFKNNVKTDVALYSHKFNDMYFTVAFELGHKYLHFYNLDLNREKYYLDIFQTGA